MKIQEKLSILFVLVMSTFMMANCTLGFIDDNSDDTNKTSTEVQETEDTNVEKGSVTLSINNSTNTSTSSEKRLYTAVITKAIITVESSDFSNNFSQVINIQDGMNADAITIDNVPAGKNRIISVQAYQDESAIPGIILRSVTEINSDQTVYAKVNWSTTALGNVYYNLLKSNCKIASISDSDDLIIQNAVDTTSTNALLVDAASIASDYLKGSLKSKSKYLLTPGTISFTFYYPIQNFTAYFNEPGSTALSNCVPGTSYTITNCSPGAWTLFLVDEDNSQIIGTYANASISTNQNTDAGVIDYDGIMIVVDKTQFADYKNLYTWNYNGSGSSTYGASYPGTEMTAYGNYYIHAFQSCTSINAVANKGTLSSDKLYSGDIELTKQGIYLLTNVEPGYTLLSKSSGTTGDDYEDPVVIDFNNSLYINLSNNSWSTTENGTYTEITTKKTTIGAETNYIKLQLTKDDDGNSTGLLEINAKNSSGASAFFFTGTKSTGGVKLQSNGTDDVMIYLNGVNFTSSNYPCFEVTKGSKTYVTVNGTNTLTDGRVYGTGYGAEFSTSSSDTYEDDDGNIVACTVSKSVVKEGSSAKSTLFSKGNLILTGTGTLTITESYKNCIGSKGFITVASGTYNLTSNSKNGFDARYGFTQDGGDITFTGNGAITAASSLSTSAYVKKTNGIVVDGIISSTDNGWIKINGGSYTCNATYGKAMNAKWDSTSNTDNDGTSTTGKPDPSVYISDGNILINVTGTGWTNDDQNGRSAKRYYDADGVAQYEIVKCAAEGIESLSKINISGGTIEITADNDCINASLTGGAFNMSGGSLYCATGSADAVDSNGNITITGGTIVVCAPMGSEDGLDCGDGGYSVKISGGLIASCSGTSNASATGNGCVIINGKSLGATSGNTLVIQDADKNLMYAFTIPTVTSSNSGSSGGMGGMGGPGGSSSSGYGSIIFASPKFTSTGTYTIYNGATVTGGQDFHGLYTSLPTVSSTGSSAGTVSVTSTSGTYSCGSSSGYGGR